MRHEVDEALRRRWDSGSVGVTELVWHCDEAVYNPTQIPTSIPLRAWPLAGYPTTVWVSTGRRRLNREIALSDIIVVIIISSCHFRA